jgi:DNA-binding transcriptional LysR family regulator
MDIHQLKTFVVVAREGSITRASELLHLSQPAASAHIKAIEDALDVVLFERTPRGMRLTADGTRLLAKAEHALVAHRDILDEATRIKGRLAGRLRIGAGSNSNSEAVGKLLMVMAERCPDVEVTLRHGTSQEILAGLRNDTLDAGFYNDGGEPDPDLTTIDVATFTTYLVAAPGIVRVSHPLDWHALAEQPWIYPTASACCGRTAELMFTAHRIRPRRIISVDREAMTRTLIAGGLGVGLLHADTAQEARGRGEVELLFQSPAPVRVRFAHLARRASDPVLSVASGILRGRAA